MGTEGLIKFNYNLVDTEPPESNLVDELQEYRDILYQSGLIGIDDRGVGYGNISSRYYRGFIISGSKTGSKDKLEPEDYSIVTDFNINLNYIRCEGKIPASSESLTHAAIYQISNRINAVIHVHSDVIWEVNMLHYPTTKPMAQYGTRDMAYEIGALLNNQEDFEKGVIIMGGHEGGIITFGEDLAHAYRNLESLMSTTP